MLSCARLLCAVAVTLVLAPGPAKAEDGRVSVVYPLSMADPEAAYELVKEVISSGGRAILDEGSNSLIVFDLPEQQATVREVLGTLQAGTRNVKVSARIVDRETGDDAGVSASGQLIIAYPDKSSRADVYFNVDRKQTTTTRSTAQSVVVTSGGNARILIGRQIPYQQWMIDYGRTRRIVPEKIKWKEVGSSLTVRPTVIDGGKRVRVRLVPAISVLAGKDRDEIAFIDAATEVVVREGEEIRVAGVEGREEFYSRFLTGYDRQRRVRQVDVYLRATVLD